MMVIGIDAHKRSHTAVMVDDNGREGATKTVGTTTQDHLRLLKWASSLDGERLWVIEDCRHLIRRLERDLIAAGESVVRVPPKLMAHIRDSARTYGKSDPIDALAVARAALREPDLPVGRLDGVERELRLLVDHREDLVAERTRIISRLRWHLHELDPGWIAPAKIERTSAFDAVAAHLAACGDATVVRRLALRLVEHLRTLTTEIDELAAEITERVTIVAPSLLPSSAAGRSRRPRSSARPPRCAGFAPRTPSPVSTAPHPCRCGHRTSSGIVCRAPGIVNSTLPCTASR
jgi:transposase